MSKDITTSSRDGAGLRRLRWATGRHRLSTPSPLVRNRRRNRSSGAAVAAIAMERRRIMATLHDDVGQHLYRVLHGLEGAAARLDEGEVREELHRLVEVVRHIDTVLRREMNGLRAAGRASDLRQELSSLAATTTRETGIEMEVRCDIDDRDLPLEAIETLVATAREAIINARKHARPGRIMLVVRLDGRAVHLEIENDATTKHSGPPVPSSGLGLALIRQRLSDLGGTLRVARLRDMGTRVVATIPVGGS